MQNPDGEADRKLDNDEKRIQVRDGVRAGRMREDHHDPGNDRENHGQDHRKDEPAAHLALGGVPIAGLCERPQPLAHDLEESPPSAADDHAADPQDHDGEGRQSAQG